MSEPEEKTPAERIAAYVVAREKFKTRDEVASAAWDIRSAGDAMREWWTAFVSDWERENEFPSAIRLDQTKKIDARTWKTAQEIGELLLKYHEHGKAAIAAYDEIPESDKAAVVPKPEYGYELGE